MKHRIFHKVLLCALLALPFLAQAQEKYPARPIRVVVPFAAGISPDVVARLWAERMSKTEERPVVVIENKPGAATIVGAQLVAAAPADGYTLLYAVGNTFSINPYIYDKLPYKLDDFIPVVRLLTVPLGDEDSPFAGLLFTLYTAPQSGSGQLRRCIRRSCTTSSGVVMPSKQL